MLYTKKGDGGQTTKFDGSLIGKDDLLIEVLGLLDEVGSFLCICKNKVKNFENKILDFTLVSILDQIQDNLFKIQANLAGKEILELKLDVGEVELIIDWLEEKLPPLNKFLKIDGSELSLLLNYERTLIRKAERKVVALNNKSHLIGDLLMRREIMVYLNRLSDLFFVLVRFVNFNENQEEKYF